MKTLLASVLGLFLLATVATMAWAGPRDGNHHGGGRPPHVQPQPPSPDLDGDGHLSTYERLQKERQDRWNRLMDAQRGN